MKALSLSPALSAFYADAHKWADFARKKASEECQNTDTPAPPCSGVYVSHGEAQLPLDVKVSKVTTSSKTKRINGIVSSSPRKATACA